MLDLTAIWQRYVKSTLVVVVIMLSIYTVYASNRIDNLSRDNEELSQLSKEYASALRIQEKRARITDITMLTRAQFNGEVSKQVERDFNEIAEIQRNVPCSDVPVPSDVTNLMRRAVAAANGHH